MNTWSLSLIKKIVDVKRIVGINDDCIFDYLKIIDLNNVKYEESAKNVLFFLTYSEEEDVENEFLVGHFDLREKFYDIFKEHPDYVFVVDEETYNKAKIEGVKCIIVDDILNSINKLYYYLLETAHAKVIAVTGSVGKTTAVGLLEEVIKNKYNVLRIYSKRITPINLKANVINFLNSEIDYIVLEMSIYHPNHVEVLSDLLKPDIAAIIGVDSSHLEFFDSIDDICKHKASVFRFAKTGFYNNLDYRINKLSIKDNGMFFVKEKIYDTTLNSFEGFMNNYEFINGELFINSKKVNLFFNSNLSVVQVLLAYKFGIFLEINEEEIIKSIEAYVPVENRLQKECIFGKNVIFDGDITTNERIVQLANNGYKKSFFIIRKFGSAENNKRFEKILNVLNNFTKVFIFNDIEYLEMLRSHDNVVVVSDHDFMKNLDGQIIYHYSGYYRSYKSFDEKNLIKIENEIYKIMKPEES